MTNTETTTCQSCGFSPADVRDSKGSDFCRIHQHKAIGTKVSLYEEITEFPDVVGYLR